MAGLMDSRRRIMMASPHKESVSGSVASFDCDMVANLKECKIHFAPVQEGSGDPSPDNVRPISGWNGVTVSHGDGGTYTEIPIEFPTTIYGGYVDLVRGEVVGEYEYVLLNSGDYIGSYNEYPNAKRVIIPVRVMPSKAKQNSTSTLRCSYFTSNSSSVEWNAFIGSTSNLLLYIPKSFTNSDFDAYLQENPLQVYYERETPVRYQLTPAQIKTLKGINNIWSDANGDVEVTYWTHK